MIADENRNKLSYIPQLRAELELDIKKQLEKEILNNLFEEFKKQVQPVIKDCLSNITIENIEAYKNVMAMRDDLMVHIKVNDDGIKKAAI